MKLDPFPDQCPHRAQLDREHAPFQRSVKDPPHANDFINVPYLSWIEESPSKRVLEDPPHANDFINVPVPQLDRGIAS